MGGGQHLEKVLAHLSPPLDIYLQRLCVSYLTAAVHEHDALGRLHSPWPYLPPPAYRRHELPRAGIEQLNTMISVLRTWWGRRDGTEGRAPASKKRKIWVEARLLISLSSGGFRMGFTVGSTMSYYGIFHGPICVVFCGEVDPIFLYNCS